MMMLFKTISTLAKRSASDLMIVPCFEGASQAIASCPLDDLKQHVAPILQAKDFKGKQGATLLAYLDGKKDKRLLLLGLGKETECSLETLRRAFAAGIKRCRNKKWETVHVILPDVTSLSKDLVLRAVCEGISLTCYVFEKWRSKEHVEPFYIKTVGLIGTTNQDLPAKTQAIQKGVNLARDLINGNACDITPQTLAQEAKRLATLFPSVKATIFDRKRLEKEKMGLLCAVSEGSSVEPALIILEYLGHAKSSDLTLIVGKGVTFDTGGLNLKPTNFIEDMKADMSGAAAALGTLYSAAAMKLKANLAVIIPATENAIDAKSYRPGDVYRAYSGKTVEITNTDAEGRLILADALTYGQKRFSPTRIIDLATLTGAIVIALGIVRSGLFSNDDQLAHLCMEAGEMTGELVWRFPLDIDYRKELKSDLADILNAAKKRGAGSITAAMFLQEFIDKKTPWIHLDIAGTAYLDQCRDYHLTPATGVGVRLLIELIEKLSLEKRKR